jgi:hypothetical protein
LFFTKKKNYDLGTSKTTSRPPRYTSLALVNINGYEGQAVLRNVSVGGFCMESKTFADMDVGAVYAIHIAPEKSADINGIELKVETRWIRSSPEKFAVGFQVVQGGGNHMFEKYVDYLKAHHHERKAVG